MNLKVVIAAFESNQVCTYVMAGINVDRSGPRGRVVLVMPHSIQEPLAFESQRFKQDLAGDGWTVHHAWGDSFDSQSTAHSRYGWRFSRANGSSKRRTNMAYDGTNADLGANVAGYFNTASDSGIAVAGGRRGRKRRRFACRNPEIACV